MKTTEENGTMNPGDSREPGDVYMMLSPTGAVRDISIDDCLYKSFGDFLNEYAYYAVKDIRSPHTNGFFVHYRFDDPTCVPTWNEEEEPLQVYYKRLETAIKEQGLKPLNICRLYPAIYCYQNGLDPLALENSQQALNKLEEYRFAALRYSCFGEHITGKTYTGIETDRGMLLFDNTEKGELLQKRYKDFFADNFFDPRLDVTFLKTIELIPNEAQRTKVNPDIALDMLYSIEPEPFGILQADYYTDIEETGIHTECECYDMSATLANFTAISQHDKDELPSLTDETYNIGCLLRLSSPECKTPDIEDELPNLFYYGEYFNPLSERFAEAATKDKKMQVMASVRELAGRLLKRDFPNIRQQPATVPRPKEQRKATDMPQTAVRQVSDVAGRLAKLPKKKNGIKL